MKQGELTESQLDIDNKHDCYVTLPTVTAAVLALTVAVDFDQFDQKLSKMQNLNVRVMTQNVTPRSNPHDDSKLYEKIENAEDNTVAGKL